MEYKIVPINNNLVENDEKLLQIEELIEAKRRMLLEKQKKLKVISKENQFLAVIKNDYTKYYNYIAQQKQDQIKALELLNEYIHDLSISGQLSKHNIDDAKFEQEKILKEVDEIKNKLDSIIKNAF
jgi:hypothetical protein